MSGRKIRESFRRPIRFGVGVNFFEASQLREMARILWRFGCRFRVGGRLRLGFRVWFRSGNRFTFIRGFHQFLGAITLEGFEFAYRVQGRGVSWGLLEIAQLLVFRRLDLVLFVLVHTLVHPIVHAGILA